jgi:hypothetical protein
MSKSKLSLICLVILFAVPSMALAQKGGKAAPPVVSSIAPTSATAGGPGFALTVSGSNFTTGSIVLWNGISITTTYVSATQLQATIPSALIGAAATAQVAVYTPGRSGGTSNSVAFTINPASTTTTTTTTPPVTPLAITTSSLPAGTTGIVYSQTLAASGGTAPYTWSTTGGAVPPGLTLSSTGGISGTPTTSGSYSFTAQVRDSVNATSSLTYGVSIAAGVTTPPLAVSTASVPGGTAGTAYSTTLAATGGTSPYTWSVAAGSTLPAGLALSTAGAISGTPDMPATYAFSVQVTDSASNTSTMSYSLAVAAPPPTTYPTGTYGNVGNPYEGGSAPATATSITACGTLSPTSGQYYLVRANLGSDPTAVCLSISYGGKFTLDLGGYTVTGQIKVATNSFSGSAIFNGTVNCTVSGSGGVWDGCIVVQSNQVPSAQARLHHLTVLNSRPGQSNIRVVWQPSTTGIANSCKLDHIASTVVSQPTSGRNYNIVTDGGGHASFEAAFNNITCPSDASACQGIQIYNAPYSYVHDNYIVLEQPTYDTVNHESARGILFDSQGKPPAGNSIAENNYIYVNRNRAVRVRAEYGDVIRNNYFYNIRLPGRLGAVDIGNGDTASDGASAEVYSNMFEILDGNAIVVAGPTNVTANIHDNSVTCYQGNCSSAGYFILLDVPSTLFGNAGPIVAAANNNTSALNAAAKAAVKVCGTSSPTGTTYYCTVTSASSSATVCNSGQAVGGGTINTTCQ